VHPVPQTVINWHVTEACNFRCHYCYAKWQRPDGRELIRDPGASAALIRALFAGFARPGARRPRLNFAGGEPLLHAGRVVRAMEQARAVGFDVSLISNGSRLDDTLATRLAPHLAMLGVSVDAVDPTVNARIGREDRRGVPLDLDRLVARIARMRRVNPAMTLKANTVVSDANWQSDLRPMIETLGPSRWKVLRMLPVVTDRLAPTDAQFRAFVDRHRALGALMCVEDNDDMVQSYIMVDPHGRFFQNRPQGSGYDYSPPILAVGAEAAFGRIAWSTSKFESRYPAGVVAADVATTLHLPPLPSDDVESEFSCPWRRVASHRCAVRCAEVACSDEEGVSEVTSSPTGKLLDGTDACEHLLPRGGVRRMDVDLRWFESVKSHRFFDPKHHVVSGASRIVSEVMVKTDRNHAP